MSRIWGPNDNERTDAKKEAGAHIRKLEAENRRLRETLELVRYSLASGNQVSGEIAKDWIEYIDAALEMKR